MKTRQETLGDDLHFTLTLTLIAAVVSNFSPLPMIATALVGISLTVLNYTKGVSK